MTDERQKEALAETDDVEAAAVVDNLEAANAVDASPPSDAPKTKRGKRAYAGGGSVRPVSALDKRTPAEIEAQEKYGWKPGEVHVGKPSTVSSMSPETKKRILDGFKTGLPRQVIADLAGVHRDTLTSWLGMKSKSPETLAFAAECARAEALGIAAALIRTRSGEPGWQGSAWFLERRHPEHFALRSKHEVSGPDGGPISVITGEQALARLESLLASEEQPRAAIEATATSADEAD